MNPQTEWKRAITTLAAVAVPVVVVAAIFWARAIFIPIALAVFLAFVLGTPVAWLQRRGLRRVPAVLSTVGLVILVVGVVGGVVTWQLAKLTETLPEYTPRITGKLSSLQSAVGIGQDNRFEKLVNDVTEVFAPRKRDPKVQTVVLEPESGSAFTQLQAYAGPVTELIGQAAFGAVLSVFMLLKKEDLRNRLIRLTGDTQLTTTTKAVNDASKRVSRYLFTQLLLNTSFGVLVFVGLLIAQVPYALLWGVLAWIMRYVPYIGTWLGLIPPVVVSMALSDGWWQPLTVIAIYGSLELICNNIFEPWLYGQSMGVSEVAQLISAAVWAFLWGPVGLVLSGPLTVCLLILGKYVPRFGFLRVLLGDEPALTADARLYQRLAAHDQDEASEIAREELKTGTPEQVFDQVVVPALSFAKRDFENHTLSREEFQSILRLTREIVYELDDAKLVPVGTTAGDADPKSRIRVLAIPAKDDSDEVVLEMFRTLMDEDRWEIEVAPVESLTSEVVTRIRSLKPAVVVIGALPPGGLAHTRYVCKRVRREFPTAKLMVGRWGLADGVEENRERLTEAGADTVSMSLAELKQHLGGWQGVLTDTQPPSPGEASPKSEAAGGVGTAAASLPRA